MNNSVGDSSRSNQKYSTVWPILGAFLFFLLSWKLDYPKPMWDDLFLNGAALNMAGGGDFSNPLLVRQGFPSHYFFLHPPFHSYAVFGWLSLFGISAGSLLAFQNLMYFIIAAATIMIIRREGCPQILSWLVPWGVAAIFLKEGLRAEPLAVALTMSGYALLLGSRQAGFRLWLSCFLLFLGTMTAERTAFFGAALILLAFWQWLKPPANNASRLRFGALSGSALALTVLLFMALVHFRLGEFYRTFHFHSNRLDAGTLGLLGRFLRQSGNGWWPIFILTVAVLCLAARYRPRNASRVSFVLAAAFLVWALAGALSHGSSWCLVFIIFLLAAALSKQIGPRRAVALQVAIAVVMIGANGTVLLEEYGVVTGKIDLRPSENRAAILALKPTKEHPVLLDGSVARDIFDYRLPPDCIDFGFSAPFPAFMPTDTKIRPEDTYVLGVGRAVYLYNILHADFPVESWSPLRNKRYASPKYPHDAYIIPAQRCIELLAKNSAPKK